MGVDESGVEHGAAPEGVLQAGGHVFQGFGGTTSLQQIVLSTVEGSGFWKLEGQGIDWSRQLHLLQPAPEQGQDGGRIPTGTAQPHGEVLLGSAIEAEVQHDPCGRPCFWTQSRTGVSKQCIDDEDERLHLDDGFWQILRKCERISAQPWGEDRPAAAPLGERVGEHADRTEAPDHRGRLEGSKGTDGVYTQAGEQFLFAARECECLDGEGSEGGGSLTRLHDAVSLTEGGQDSSGVRVVCDNHP